MRPSEKANLPHSPCSTLHRPPKQQAVESTLPGQLLQRACAPGLLAHVQHESDEL
jgi:hypothetical protein